MPELTRRRFVPCVAAVLAAGPLARELVAADPARAQLGGLPGDATLRAFADPMIPGRTATRTDRGNPIDPRGITGVDKRPGALDADTLSLYHPPPTVLDALE